MRSPAKQDGIVGAPHGLHEFRMRWWHGGRGHTVDDIVQGEVQGMRFMQCHFQYSGNDLHPTRQAAGWG